MSGPSEVAGVLGRPSVVYVWIVLGVLVAVVEAATVLGRRVVPVGRLLGSLMRPWPAKALLLAGWWWLGWHFLAR